MDPRVAELEAMAEDMKKRDRLPDALRCMEDALALRVTAQGRQHPEAQAAAEAQFEVNRFAEYLHGWSAASRILRAFLWSLDFVSVEGNGHTDM